MWSAWCKRRQVMLGNSMIFLLRGQRIDIRVINGSNLEDSNRNIRVLSEENEKML